MKTDYKELDKLSLADIISLHKEVINQREKFIPEYYEQMDTELTDEFQKRILKLFNPNNHETRP